MYSASSVRVIYSPSLLQALSSKCNLFSKNWVTTIQTECWKDIRQVIVQPLCCTKEKVQAGQWKICWLPVCCSISPIPLNWLLSVATEFTSVSIHLQLKQESQMVVWGRAQQPWGCAMHFTISFPTLWWKCSGCIIHLILSIIAVYIGRTAMDKTLTWHSEDFSLLLFPIVL